MWRSSSSLLVAAVILAGCATTSNRQDDYLRMDQRAAQEGFLKRYLSAPPFTLTAYCRTRSPSDTLVVYIEGDGLSWLDRALPSDDPTPRNAVAFELAVQDPSPNVVYLARPGQFEAGGTPVTDPAYWQGKRYSPEVVRALNAVIDSQKNSTGANRVSIIGYSGGGALAVMVAARRRDVSALRTVAGNLDLELFTRLHGVTPLRGSLDPLSAAKSVKDIPQRHFVGARDTVVPESVASSFLDQAGDISHARLFRVAGADHRQGWADRWRELLTVPLK